MLRGVLVMCGLVLIGYRIESTILIPLTISSYFILIPTVLGAMIAIESRKPIYSILGYIVIILPLSELAARNLVFEQVSSMWYTGLIITVEMTFLSIWLPKVVNTALRSILVAFISAVVALLSMYLHNGTAGGSAYYLIYLLIIAGVAYQWHIDGSRPIKTLDCMSDSAVRTFVNLPEIVKKKRR